MRHLVRSRIGRLVGGAALAAVLGVAPAAHAESRTLNYLTTGNGLGFQIFDATRNKITYFLEHPYVFLKPDGDLKSNGVVRRNLAYDVYFGVKAAAGASGWLNGSGAQTPAYVEESNIVVAPANVAGVTAESYFFAPFDYPANAMVGLLHAPSASDGYALLNFHMGSGTDSPGANGENLRAIGDFAVAELGPGGGAMVYVGLSDGAKFDCASGAGAAAKLGQELSGKRDCAGDDTVVVAQGKLAPDGWLAVGVQFVENAADADAAAAAFKAWAAGKTSQAILDGQKTEWTAWRKPVPSGVSLSDDEKFIWRQGEAVLRMGQVREPWGVNGRTNTGMILASLPPGDWDIGWVRDAQYAIVALARTGHHAEAKAALDFLLNTPKVGKANASFYDQIKGDVAQTDYRISLVRYFGDGQEHADWNPDGWNVELDGWGMVMWSARQYVDATCDTAWLTSPTKLGKSVYDTLIDGVAKPLEANVNELGIVNAESSIWEVHQGLKQEYAYTTMAAVRGFCDMAALAKKAGKDDDAKHYRDLQAKMRTAFFKLFVNENSELCGYRAGLAPEKCHDGAVAEAFNWDILSDFKGTVALKTLDGLGQLRGASGGFFRRSDGNQNNSYDTNEWIMVDLRISDAMRRSGVPERVAAADALLKTIVDRARLNFNLLPELYNNEASKPPIGAYAGSIPMVGYGPGAYMLTLLDRAGMIEPNDCGDGAGVSVTCSADGGPPTVTVNDAGPSGGGGTGEGENGAGAGPGASGAPDTTQVPRVGACLCRLSPQRDLPAGAFLLGIGPAAILVRRIARRVRGR